jgi:hypothetical protein
MRLLGLLLATPLLFGFSASGSTVQDLSNGPRIHVHVKDGSSTNWSGYALETNLLSPQSGAVSDVQGQWVVPTLTCGSENTYSSAWVGIDGYSSSTVEQTGTEQDCRSGVPTYYAWYEMYPKFPLQLSLPVKAGDTISAEVKYIGNAKFQLTLTDVTTGKAFQTIQKSTRAQRSSAEWVMEAPSSSGGVLPLANFGTAGFSSAQATVNGHTGVINDSAWQNDAITMVSSTGTIKASPSTLSSTGNSFNVTWKYN